MKKRERKREREVMSLLCERHEKATGNCAQAEGCACMTTTTTTTTPKRKTTTTEITTTRTTATRTTTTLRANQNAQPAVSVGKPLQRTDKP